MPNFVKVAGTDEIALGGKKLTEIDGRAIAVFHVDNAYFAIDDVCTHDGGPLADGALVGCEVECPRHGGSVRCAYRQGASVSPRSNPSPRIGSRVATTAFTSRSKIDPFHSSVEESA